MTWELCNHLVRNITESPSHRDGEWVELVDAVTSWRA